jgi:hypothetical protein
MIELIYIFCWALAFATSIPSSRVLKYRLKEVVLPTWMLEQKGRRLAYWASVMVFLSVISLFVWGVFYLKWYLLIVDCFVGLVLSGFIQKVISPASLICLGPLLLLFVNAFLWAISMSR